MTTAPLPDRHTYLVAKALAEKGYLVFPCRRFSKVPATTNGFKDASCDPAQIAAWFDNDKGYNLAVACGLQPNDVHLGAIDIDPKNGGDVTWQTLTDRHGVPLAPRHETPHKGIHLFFNSALITTGPNTLGDGIDTRGTGGYVVVPPSRLTTDDGELIVYSTTKPLALVYNDPPALTPWLAELLTKPDPIQESIANHPSQGRVDDSLYDLIRERFGPWPDELARDGWTETRGSGGDRRFTRPGKDPRDGHSATLHPSGAFVVFTQTRPFGGKPTNGAGGATFSPAEYVAAYRFGGDVSAMARHYRTGAAPRVRAAPGGDSAGDGQVPPAVGTTVTRLPLTDQDYWTACERNQHIYVAARASMVAPDALDAVMYAMQSCLVPPSYLIESLVGGPQPLNMLACLVARTGDFKTATSLAALELMGPFPPWVTSIGMGSGEGIGAMFLRDEVKEEKGRKVKTGNQERNDLRAVFFEADEGSGLNQQAIRQGATVIANLCKAWSGSMLGEANADHGRRRRVLHNDYRIGAVVNIQPGNFGGLFSEANTGTGLTGRFLFSGTLDADIPDEEPPWPGQLPFPSLPETPITITIDPEIKAAAKAAIRDRHRQGSLNGSADNTAQVPATQARMAALLALADDRRRITTDDWDVAGMRAQASAGCLQVLSDWNTYNERDRRHAAAVARAEAETTIDDIKERRAVARLAASINAKTPAGGIGRRQLMKAVTSAGTRHRFDAALELATANTWVHETEAGRIERM